MKIIPTVFAKNKKEFDSRFAKLSKVSKELQVDFMDGKLVRAKGIRLSDIPNLRGKGNFEAHLMVANPGKWILGLKKKGFKKVLFHYESFRDIRKIENLIVKLKKAKMKVFITVNPGTSVKKIMPFLTSVDGVMFMGVNPGRENQRFVPGVFEKIKELRRHSKGVKIQVDGGVSDKTIGRLKRSGVDIVNSGSYISDAEKPREALARLRKAAK